ncbi:MAG: hypothetical protein HW421_2831 [Ignavibacteria bacterium]|nr:hypothetical protein [Ignavibacteria bacterium]
MYEIVFNSKLTENGALYCPKEYSFIDADYKVILTLPDNNEDISEAEKSAIIDNSSDFLSAQEISYYLNLDEK